VNKIASFNFIAPVHILCFDSRKADARDADGDVRVVLKVAALKTLQLAVLCS